MPNFIRTTCGTQPAEGETGSERPGGRRGAGGLVKEAYPRNPRPADGKPATGSFRWRPGKGRKPKARPSGDEWFVYMVRCADGSHYTGIAKDVTRRCQQHNAGTAS